MRDLPRFIKLGEDRINVDEIVAYGIRYDSGEEFFDDGNESDNEEEYEEGRYLYVETKTSEFIFEYWEGDVDFDIDKMLVELDAMFLVAAHRTR
ncbi:MAG: hypothetical protein IKP64_09205 [Selenomonadaceae bacterium]|nr:hypothetical protein [Selenomonadaceae bacterium]